METAFESFLEQNKLLEQRYQLVSLLGSGATGSVFLAHDTQCDNHKVAIKLLHPHLLLDNNTYSRFRSETRITMRLSHPNILTSFGMGRHSREICFLKMEYCDGISLAELMNETRYQEDPSFFLLVLRSVADALAYAHSLGIVHRDIKPENVLVTSDREVLVADFGIAQMVRQESNLTGHGKVLGTPYYMSPEQLRSELIDGRADMYSFGVMAFQLITGRLPYRATSFWELADQHITSEIPVALLEESTAPDWLTSLVFNCMQKNRKDRPGSMADVLSLIDEHSDISSTTHSAARVRNEKGSAVLREHPNTLYQIQKNSDRTLRIFLYCGLALLIFAPPRVNSSARWRYSIISLAAERQLDTKLPWLRMLLNTEADVAYPESLFRKDLYRHHALPLLLAGYDPNYYDESRGAYPIHFAVANHYPRLLRELCKSGALVNVRDSEGRTPLYLAVEKGYTELLRYLIENNADPNIVPVSQLSALTIAAKNARYDIIKILLEESRVAVIQDFADEEGNTPLHHAVRSRNSEAVALLISHVAAIDVANSAGLTPIDLANQLQPREEFKEIIELLESARSET